MQELIGVKFAPNVSKTKPWRAQINRIGRAFYLGLFPRSEEACRAYDNAAYYLKPWSARSLVALNFPHEWEGVIPPASDSTIKIREILRTLRPEAEMQAQAEANKANKDSDTLEYKTMELLETFQFSVSILRRRFTEGISRMKLLEARLGQAEEDIKQRDRIIEGLRVQGGQQFFRKVDHTSLPVTAVEAHLM